MEKEELEEACDLAMKSGGGYAFSQITKRYRELPAGTSTISKKIGQINVEGGSLAILDMSLLQIICELAQNAIDKDVIHFAAEGKNKDLKYFLQDPMHLNPYLARAQNENYFRAVPIRLSGDQKLEIIAEEEVFKEPLPETYQKNPDEIKYIYSIQTKKIEFKTIE